MPRSPEPGEVRCQTCHRPMRADALHRPFCSLACQKRADDYADYANDAARDCRPDECDHGWDW